jgi:hypothetical protein
MTFKLIQRAEQGRQAIERELLRGRCVLTGAFGDWYNKHGYHRIAGLYYSYAIRQARTIPDRAREVVLVTNASSNCEQLGVEYEQRGRSCYTKATKMEEYAYEHWSTDVEGPMKKVQKLYRAGSRSHIFASGFFTLAAELLRRMEEPEHADKINGLVRRAKENIEEIGPSFTSSKPLSLILFKLR